jgi:hypothetical protein
MFIELKGIAMKSWRCRHDIMRGIPDMLSKHSSCPDKRIRGQNHSLFYHNRCHIVPVILLKGKFDQFGNQLKNSQWTANYPSPIEYTPEWTAAMCLLVRASVRNAFLQVSNGHLNFMKKRSINECKWSNMYTSLLDINCMIKMKCQQLFQLFLQCQLQYI